MTVINIPKVLNDKLTPKGANALVEILDKVEQNAMDKVVERLDRRIAQSEEKIVRWTFLFIFGQFWMIVGAMYAF